MKNRICVSIENDLVAKLESARRRSHTVGGMKLNQSQYIERCLRIYLMKEADFWRKEARLHQQQLQLAVDMIDLLEGKNKESEKVWLKDEMQA